MMGLNSTHFATMLFISVSNAQIENHKKRKTIDLKWTKERTNNAMSKAHGYGAEANSHSNSQQSNT